MHRWLGLGLKRASGSQLRLMASKSSPVRRAAAVGISSFGIGIGTASLAHPVQLEPSIQTPVCVVVGAGSKFGSRWSFATGLRAQGPFSLTVLPHSMNTLPQGYTVVIMSRSLKNLEPIAEYINNKLGVRCVPIECDCTSEEDIKRAFAAVKRIVGEVLQCGLRGTP